MSQTPGPLKNFCGLARLFPLPDLVLFPQVIQPLHVFEARYRQLMSDALQDDRLIAMAVLRPGWEESYHKKPAIYPTVCIGQIYQEECLSDGRYNLLLRGVQRARVIEEVNTDKQYRVGRVELLPDVPILFLPTEQSLRRQLGECLTRWFAAQSATLNQLRRLLESNLPLGSLCDIFSFALPLEMEVKRQLLEERRVEERTRLLLGQLDVCQQTPSKPSPRPFPPNFSNN